MERQRQESEIINKHKYKRIKEINIIQVKKRRRIRQITRE
jgi:hypothetical protein